MEINHLFKLYHGVAEPMKIYIAWRSAAASSRSEPSLDAFGSQVLW